MRTPFPYLGSGSTDCAEIWCVVRDPLAKRFAQVKSGVDLHLRTCHLFSVSWDRLDQLRWNLVCGYGSTCSVLQSCYDKGYYACSHVRTSFSYLGILWTHHVAIWCVFRPINYALYSGYTWRISASAQVKMNILFKHIYCSLPLVHRPKDVLLVKMVQYFTGWSRLFEMFTLAQMERLK